VQGRWIALCDACASDLQTVGGSLSADAAARTCPGDDYAITGTGGILAAAVSMGAITVLIVRTAVFGRWLAWVGAVAVLIVVGAAIALSGVLAIPALLVWAVAVSFAMWRTAGTTSKAPA
jgi:hypothetical protein